MKLSRRTVVVVFAIGALSNAFGIVDPSWPALTNFDARQRQFGLRVPAEKVHAAAKLRERLPEAQIDFAEVTASPKRIATTRGFLTGPNGVGRAASEESARGFRANDPHRATKAFLKEHQPLFGHGPEALEKTRVKRDYITPHNGLRTVVWEQEVDGIPVFQAVLISHTTRRGELVNISSQFVADPRSAANKGHRNKARGRNEPMLSAAEAVLKAGQNLGEPLQLADIQPQGQGEGAELRQKFKAKRLTGDTEAKLVWLPMSATELRLCWEIILTSRTRGEMFRVLVDAEGGEALLRHSLTDYISEATYRVYTSDSPSPLSPGHSAPSTRQPPLVPRSLITITALDTNASPNGWINDRDNETRGNNVDAYSDRDGDNEPDLPRPQGSPFRVFDFPLDLTQPPTNYTKAAIVQLFYRCNWMHDRLYELGFTEAAGNFQVDNFGRGGEGNDAVEAEAQKAAGFSNANFASPPDGKPGRMRMFLWSEPFPDRDGCLDAQVVLHEYTHGMTRRRVGGGIGFSATQSVGMNEGWSDFFALAMLSKPADDPDGTYPISSYSGFLLGHAQNYYFGIRRYPYCTDTNKNPLTFKDIDPTRISPHPGVPRNPRSAFNAGAASEFHAQGEVWCNTLWEIRANLIRKHGFELGNWLAMQLVADGQALLPPDPDFIQARDGIVQADFVNTGGANFQELWAGFAKRGMGLSASAPDSLHTVGVQEAFDMADDLWIVPRTDWFAKGRIRGPFEPGTRRFSLETVTSPSVTWSAWATVPWLGVSSASGTVQTGAAPAVVQASINSMASLLPSGVHTGAILFSNHLSARVQTNIVTLQTDPMDFLTEFFDRRDNDLAYQSITFTPDGSPSSYSVCHGAATNFPVDPTGGARFSTNANTSDLQVTLSAGRSVALFGSRTNAVWVHRDGSVSPLDGRGGEWVLEEHFRQPRISGLRNVYDPVGSDTNGICSWKQLSDRLAVTYQNVLEMFSGRRDNFQIELFYDGRIRFTYLDIQSASGIVGLSRGGGIPPGFVESDFSAYPGCQPRLVVTAPQNVAESAGRVTGTVSRAFAEPTELVVTLVSDNPSEIKLPISVVIAPGQSSAAFEISVVDDSDLDGTHASIITASAPGYGNGYHTVLIVDNENAIMNLSLPASATKGDTVQATVTLSAQADKHILILLTTSDPSIVQAPSFVTIPPGETSAGFDVTVVENSRIEVPKSVTVAAQVPNWRTNSAVISVQDNKRLDLFVTAPRQVSEAAGVLSNRASVRIPGTLQSNLPVSLISSDLSQLRVPATVIIPAGQTSASFDITLINDPQVDVPQPVTITGRATGWTDGSASVVVYDDETPSEPFAPAPADFTSNQPMNVTLSWKSGLGNLIANGDFETGSFSGWTRRVVSSSRSVINDGTYDDPDLHPLPYISGGPLPVFAGAFSAILVMGQCGNSGLSQLSQDISLSPNASSATLSWADRVIKMSSREPTNRYFTVEIRDTNDVLREVLFGPPGAPWTTNWTTRSFSLSRYLGETIRLVWREEESCIPLVIYLDEIALQVSSSITTSFDLYFGTNATPGGNEFQGSTASNAWNVTSLNPDTTYFWKLVAKRGAAMVSGPVWQFRTAPALPVHHFAWSAVATQQYVGYPFFVSLTTQSAVSNVVADFNQPVTIRGSLTTGQRQLFLQNFEDGNSNGWNSDEGQGAYSQSVTTETAAMGHYSLSLIGGNRQHLDGLRHVFSRFVMRPDEIRFSVRASETNKAGGFFGVGNDSGAGGLGALFYMGPSGRMGVFEENTGFRGTNYVANQWYHVSLLFDWVRRRIACAVDGQTIATNFPFHFTFLEDVVSLHLYNFDNTQAWWDEIELVEGNRVVPIVIAPTGVSNFADGAWTGPITVAEPGQNISLAAMDGMGRFGVSSLFNVDANTDSDGDGLPDAWELRYFGSLNGNASDDPDHDGLTDLQEFRAGTLANDASSALRIEAVELNGGMVRLRFNSVAGKMYQLERATVVDDGAWEFVGNPVIGDGSTLLFSDMNDVNFPGRFYRIRLVP